MKLFSKIKKSVTKKLDKLSEPEETSSKITHDTLNTHKEEVLAKAKKLITPLQASKHRVALISAILTLAIIVVFLSSVAIGIYRYGSSNSFIYQVSRVVPFPIAKLDGRFIWYRDYLFELRTAKHFSQSQQNVDFNTTEGEKLLDSLKRDALTKIQENSIVLQLGDELDIEVNEDEIEKKVAEIASQSGTEARFEEILREFYGWRVQDLKNQVEILILKEKIPIVLKEKALKKMEAAKSRIEKGEGFDKVAQEVSDDKEIHLGVIDTTKNSDFHPEIIKSAKKLGKDQMSEIIETSNAYYLLKVTDTNKNNKTVSRITVEFNDISQIIQSRLDKAEVDLYVNVTE